MKVENNTQPIQSTLDTCMNQKTNHPNDINPIRIRSQHLSSEITSMLLMLVLAVLILPAIGLLPSAANGIRMQNLIHTR
jgi:hypothetical protein